MIRGHGVGAAASRLILADDFFRFCHLEHCCKKDTLHVFFLPLLPACCSQNLPFTSFANLGKRDLARIFGTLNLRYSGKDSMARLMLEDTA